MSAQQGKASSHFRPAIESPRTRTLISLASRPILRAARGVQRVEIASADLKRLRDLRDERVVLTPNHPTSTDPALMFELSRRAQMPFHYLCCREAFDKWGGLWGALIQRIGAYSVVRGTADRASFAFTREVLAQPAAKLVIFPEGEVYSQNDSLLPFQTGAAQLALWGREAARKNEPDAQVWLLPCALRYRFLRDVSAALSAKLAALEQHLKLPPGPTRLYPRMRRVAVHVFEAVEAEYNLHPAADDDLTPRLEAAKEAALARAIQLFGVEPPRGTLPERMRAVLHDVEEAMHEAPLRTAEQPTFYALQRQRAERVRLAWRDLQRLANWLAIYDGYASRAPSQERIAEVIYRLEMEVFERATYAGVRVASVRVGEPIALPAKISRRDLPALTLQLEQAVAALLHKDTP
jgi:1-acyl-sn-glycerol-3-phosphate acyltransferase